MNRTRLCHGISMAVLCTFAFSCSGGVSQQASLDSPGTAAVLAQGWDILKLNSYNYADTELDTVGHFKTVPNACRQDAAGAIDISLWNRIATLVNRGLALPVLDDASKLCFNRSENSKLFGTVDVVLSNPATTALFSEAAVPTPMMSWPWPWPWDPRPSSTPTPTPTVSATPTVTPTVTPSVRPSASPSPSPSQVKRTILENAGNQICTTMKDQQIAQDLVDALDQLAAIAFKEDCERAP
jgi:hypothetical protein